MKFYFCETCGKRLTEDQIKEGAARDKKLKGVFCSDCAIGVSTMDTLPLSNEQARELLSNEVTQEKPPSARGSSSSQPAGRRASGRRTTSGVRRPASASSSRISSREMVAVSSRKMVVPVVIGAAVAFALAVVLVLLVSGGQQPQVAEKGSATTQPAVEDPALQDLLTDNKNPEVPPDPSPATESPAEEPDTTTQKPALDLTPNEDVAKVEKKESLDARKSPSPEPPKLDAKAPDSGEATTKTKEGGETEIGEKKEEDEAKEATTSKEPTPKAPEKLKVNDLALDPFITRIVASLNARNLKEAQEAVGEMKGRPEMEGLDAARASLKEALEFIDQREKARIAALKAKTGKVLMLPTKLGARKGRIIEVTDEAVRLQVEYMVNGKRKLGPELKIALKDLTESAWRNIITDRKPESDDEWLGQTLSLSAGDDLDAAEDILERFKDRPIEFALRRCLDQRRHAAHASGKKTGALKSKERPLTDRELKRLPTHPFSLERVASADGYVSLNEKRQRCNASRLRTLHAQSGGASASRAILRFNLRGFHSSTLISEARLNLTYREEKYARAVDIHSVDASDGERWSEKTMDETTFPEPLKKLGRAEPSGDKLAFDLTAYIQSNIRAGHPNCSVILTGTVNNTNTSFFAREDGQSPPMLSIRGESKFPVVSVDADSIALMPAQLAVKGHAQGKPGEGKELPLRWMQLDGPGRATFQRSNKTETSVRFSKAGRYQLALRAGEGKFGQSHPFEVLVSTHRVRIKAQSDADTQRNQPDKNFGSAKVLDFMEVGQWERHSFIRFDLRSVRSRFRTQRAILRCYAERTGNTNISICQLRREDEKTWGETSVTFQNKPKLEGQRISMPRSEKGEWFECDVTAWVLQRLEAKGDQISFGLRGQRNNVHTWFSSREGEHPPELVLEGERK